MSHFTELLPDALPTEPLVMVQRWLAESWERRLQPNPNAMVLATVSANGQPSARVLFGDGWGLIRASNTQPILVTRYEARTPERRDAIRHEMEAWLRAQGVDPTPGVGH